MDQVPKISANSLIVDNQKKPSKPKPSSISNINKARDARLKKVQERKDESDLKRLLELQAKKGTHIATSDLTAPKQELTAPKQEVIKIEPKPLSELERTSHSRQKKTTLIDSDSDSSDSDSSQEIIYVPSKKARKTISKSKENDHSTELDRLRQQLFDLQKQQPLEKQTGSGSNNTPTNTPTSENLTHKAVEKVKTSARFNVDDPIVKEMLRYKILTF